MNIIIGAAVLGFLFILAASGYIYQYGKELEKKSEELRKHPLLW